MIVAEPQSVEQAAQLFILEKVEKPDLFSKETEKIDRLL